MYSTGMNTSTPFALALAAAIKRQVKLMKADGIDSCTMQNLRAVTHSPSSALAGAPAGTNAQWAYAELFRDVCHTPGMKIGSFLSTSA